MTTIVASGGFVYSDSRVVLDQQNPLRRYCFLDNIESLLEGTRINNSMYDIQQGIEPEAKFCFPTMLYYKQNRIKAIAATGNLEFLKTFMKLKRKTQLKEIINSSLSERYVGFIFYAENADLIFKIEINQERHFNMFSTSTHEKLRSIKDGLDRAKSYIESEMARSIQLFNSYDVTTRNFNDLMFTTNSSYLTRFEPALRFLLSMADFYKHDPMFKGEELFTPEDVVTVACMSEHSNSPPIFKGDLNGNVVKLEPKGNNFDIYTRFQTAVLLSTIIKNNATDRGLLVNDDLRLVSPYSHRLLYDFIHREGFFRTIA